MEPDKTDTNPLRITQLLHGRQSVIVELGCGPTKKQGRIGIDCLDLPGVDIVADLEKGLPFLPDNSVDEVHARSLLEHVGNLAGLMRDLCRIVKPGGTIHIFVPHFSNPYFYSDYTHSKFFGLYTFYYFVRAEKQLQRKVPVFYQDIRFEVRSLELQFASRFPVIKQFRKLFGKIINSRSIFQEFYEENLCYFVPCYGLYAVLTPEK